MALGAGTPPRLPHRTRRRGRRPRRPAKRPQRTPRGKRRMFWETDGRFGKRRTHTVRPYRAWGGTPENPVGAAICRPWLPMRSVCPDAHAVGRDAPGAPWVRTRFGLRSPRHVRWGHFAGRGGPRPLQGFPPRPFVRRDAHSCGAMPTSRRVSPFCVPGETGGRLRKRRTHTVRPYRAWGKSRRGDRPGRPRTPYMASLQENGIPKDVCWLGQFPVETAKKVQGYGRDVQKNQKERKLKSRGQDS